MVHGLVPFSCCTPLAYENILVLWAGEPTLAHVGPYGPVYHFMLFYMIYIWCSHGFMRFIIYLYLTFSKLLLHIFNLIITLFALHFLQGSFSTSSGRANQLIMQFGSSHIPLRILERATSAFYIDFIPLPHLIPTFLDRRGCSAIHSNHCGLNSYELNLLK